MDVSREVARATARIGSGGPGRPGEVSRRRRVAAGALALVAALAGAVLVAAPASAANERDSAFFNNSGQVCIEGIDATTVLGDGRLQFQSATRSLQLNCTTDRSLPAGYITTATGVRAIDATAGTAPYCGYVASASNGSTAARVDATYVQLTPATIRSMCGIPAGHFAAAGAYSNHSAVIYGTWSQQGFVVGAVSNAI